MAPMIARILSVLLGLVVIGLALVFFSVIVAVVLAVGLLLWGWTMLRGQRGSGPHIRMRTAWRTGARRRGEVIEGEHRVIDQR